VPTIEGKAQLKIPPGTQPGAQFRMRERGIPSLRNPQARGDQFVEVQVSFPKVISEETKELLKRYAQLNPENPRGAMGLE
jgi:DnaJ-class molecular chaperone